MNHAIMDAASMANMLGDITLAYEGRLSNISSPQYSVYIEYLQQKSELKSKKYWMEQLSGVESCIFPHMQENKHEENHLRSLHANIEESIPLLRAFCENNSVTVPSIFQTVWGLVLRFYTGSDQVCFGYLVSGRDISVPGVETIIGPFINMLICRMIATPDASLSELVQSVQSNANSALDHQHCSLAEIQHWLKQSGRPLFNTIMSVQKLNSSGGTPSGLSFVSTDAHDPTEVCVIALISQYPATNLMS